MGSTRENGQAIIVFVIFLTVLLGFVAVLVDGGMSYVERRDMQGTADAAALAAVRELPTSATQANNRAHEYVTTRNADAKGTLRSIQFSDSNRQVRVTVGKSGTQNFGALLGLDAPDIAASATARVQMMGARPGMLPIAFMRDRFTIGHNEEIKWDDPGGGNRGAIAPQKQPNCSEASGANDFRDLIKGDAHGGIDACATAIAETLDTEPGQMSGATRQGFDARLAGNNQTFDDVFKIDPVTGFHTIEDTDSPRIGIVPIIENVNGTNNWPNGRSAPIRILGYMIVYIGNTSVPGNPAYTDNGHSVWVTPVRPLLPEDFEDGAFVDYNASLPSPVVFRLTD
ncbi:MAG: putative Flp pilus-assembly TadE/G-like [Thermoleophilia bacterium]|nr:putative Flp pilus-assembly TadE/G-like [Thermoleophilia bacterium]